MKKFWILAAILLAFALLALPALADAGRGGGHPGGSHGGNYIGRHRGGSHQVFRGPAARGYYHGHPHYRGYPVAPFFFGAGVIGGYYWLGNYYYPYPYPYRAYPPAERICRQFVPTEGTHLEFQQDPNTGQTQRIEVQNGYWAEVPCP